VSVAFLLALLTTAVLASGCATTTRSGQLGPLPHDERLVSLLVTDDPAVVRRECPPALIGSAMGCQTAREVRLASGRTARAVKIVRFADRVPSEMAFEIDIHELCHAVASVQGIDDPCHAGNAGVVQAPSAAPRSLFIR
jgi:hypothetical protein